MLIVLHNHVTYHLQILIMHSMINDPAVADTAWLFFIFYLFLENQVGFSAHFTQCNYAPVSVAQSTTIRECACKEHLQMYPVAQTLALCAYVS